jgi:transcriptional regulator with PAS, ATPase and Fis domain
MTEFVFGKSAVMKEIEQTVKKVARSDLPILLEGETGTGKSLLARKIHAISKRAEAKFLKLDCATLPATLVESELFGFEKGAFTSANATRRGLFEEACGGTVFLDEVENLDSELQSKLLNVLEEKHVRRLGGNRNIQVDFRLISASNDNIRRRLQQGSFRADLYYRLKGTEVFIPPLRERRGDIIELAEMFLDAYNATQKNVKVMTDEVKSCLSSYSWPGNIRELRYAVEEAAVKSAASQVRLVDFSLDFQKTLVISGSVRTQMTLQEVEKQYVSLILDSVNFNKVKAAKILGIGLNTLYRKIGRYEINCKKRPDHFDKSRHRL